jgi:hypothetical protein
VAVDQFKKMIPSSYSESVFIIGFLCKKCICAKCAPPAYRPTDHSDDAVFTVQTFTLKSDIKLAFVFLFHLTNELSYEGLNCISTC